VDVALERGWTVAVVDLSHDGDLPDDVDFYACDVRDRGAVTAAVAAVREKHGRIDALHANAGVPDWEPFLEMSEQTYRRTMAVNVEGMFVVGQAVGAVMAAQGAGAMVFSSSVRSVSTTALHSAYSASKGAVNSLVTAMSTELGPLGIRVNAVLPGAVETPMQQTAADLFHDGSMPALTAELAHHIPLGRQGSPREIGEVVVFLLSDASSYVHGALLPVDGGLLTRLW
jgi:NAD(P)-dependent dehydrogenase (short-subunit alcohol dehydrogenase family)